jgi:hypothetical protein
LNRDFGKLLTTWGGDPLMWREHAIELKLAADTLLPSYYDALRERPNAPGTQRRLFAYLHGYLLLAGLAIENALKGLRIAADPSLVTSDGVSKTILGRGGHGIKAGLQRCFSLDADEEDVATRLEEYLFWAAKYPVPLGVPVLANAELNNLRSYISSDPDVVDRLFGRVLELYTDSRSPYS